MKKKEHSEQLVTNILQAYEIKVEENSYCNVVRLGKKKDQTPSPLKLKFPDLDKKHSLY